MKKEIAGTLLIIGLIALVSAGQVDKPYLCNNVLSGIEAGFTNDQIISQIYIDTTVLVPDSLIQDYRDNWNDKCSDTTGLILDPGQLCSKIYYLTISTNFNYTQAQIEGISQGISLNATMNYITNYYALCYLPGYSSQLPRKQISEIIIKSNDSCDLTKTPPFEGNMPFFNIYAGNSTCSTIQFWNTFFSFDEYGGQYMTKGVRTWFVILMFILLVVFVMWRIYKNAKKSNKG